DSLDSAESRTPQGRDNQRSRNQNLRPTRSCGRRPGSSRVHRTLEHRTDPAPHPCSIPARRHRRGDDRGRKPAVGGENRDRDRFIGITLSCWSINETTSAHYFSWRTIMRGGPLIKHLDDVPWFEAMRLRFDDGHTASIWEKWIEYTPRYVVFYNVWEPGALA